MAEKRTTGSGERVLSLEQSCLHLRHKLMYVDERQMAPGLVDDSSSTRVFYCARNWDQLGEDGEPVSPEDCRPGRGCYCGGS